MIAKRIAQKLSIPPILYHATFSSYIDSIRKDGLRASGFSGNLGVYLAADPDLAESFAEVFQGDPESISYDAPQPPEEDQIVIIGVNTQALDQSKLERDSNVSQETEGSYFYRGSIPSSSLSIPV